jgi:hypothetical protein
MSAGYYRYRRPGQVSPGGIVAIATVVVVLSGAASAHPGHPGHAAPASVATAPALTAAIPAASSYTPATWSRAFLLAAGYAATTCNLAFVVAWTRGEGGHWHNKAKYNPLDDELPEPGSHRINTTGPGQGVQAYVSWGQGLAATRFTLSGPDYTAIRAALRAGNDPRRATRAVLGSQWGTRVIPKVSC